MFQQRFSVESRNKNGKGVTKLLITGLVAVSLGMVILAFISLYAVLDRPWGFKEGIWYFIGDTVFSKEYSEIGFRRVRAGMSSKDVRKSLGDPLRRYRNVADIWIYEDSDGSNVELYFHYQGLNDQICYSLQDSNTVQLDSLMSCQGKRQSKILIELGWPKKKVENR